MVIRIRKAKSTDTPFLMGIGNNSILEQVSSILIAIIPLLQHYSGFYRNSGFAVLLIILPIFLLRSMVNIANGRLSSNCIKAIVPLVLYELYTIFSHSFGVNNLIYGMFMILVFTAIACQAVNGHYFFKTALFICKLATLCIFIQYITYYLFHHHIQLIPVRLLLPGSDRWIVRAIRGVSRAGELYRPSAFFLEPSHFFLYSFPVLCMLLFSPDKGGNNIRNAVIVSIGMVLSTSGFSVVTLLIIWSIYFILHKKNKTSDYSIWKLISVKSILVGIFMAVIFMLAYFYLNIFREIVARIFDTEAGTSIAISGRVRLASDYLSTLHGSSIIFGVSDRITSFDFNMPGFHSTLYKWGIIGVGLSYWYYFQSVVKLKGPYYYISLIIIILSFFSAHTHGTFYMIYFTIFLMNGFATKKMLV